MVILDYKQMFIEELVRNVVNAKIQLREKRFQEEVPIGVVNVRNKKGFTLVKKQTLLNILPGIELFSQGATP